MRTWSLGVGLVLLALPGFASGTKEEAVAHDPAPVPTIVTREVEYSAGGQRLVGYLAYDASVKTPRPGILVVHEWTGLNAYAKKRAEDLAKAGYVGFALDMYGEGKEIPAAEAAAMSRKVGTDFTLIPERFNAAVAVLRGQPQVDGTKLAAIGYCFGGGVVLNMARLGTTLAGVVGFHSSINTGLTAAPGAVKTKVLAIQGDGDPAAPPAAQAKFREEMTNAGADFQHVVYPNLAIHNFTNPEGPGYSPKEAEAAWNSMLAFFQKVLPL